jgi:GT2 family glycosyltransferase
MKQIFTTYNRLDLLKQTFSAWEKNGLDDFVIIDNGSTERGFEYKF